MKVLGGERFGIGFEDELERPLGVLLLSLMEGCLFILAPFRLIVVPPIEGKRSFVCESQF